VTPLRDRFIAASDVTPDQTWRLLEWCAQHGADEFTVAMLALEGSSATFLGEAEAALKPFERPTALRRALTVLVGRPAVQPTKLWSLNAESIAILKRLFTEGLFTYPTSEWEVGCLEDPAFYRDGGVMLGVVSHEREGVLSLTESEQAQVAALKIPTRDRPQWI
jgi:hypothetical protein